MHRSPQQEDHEAQAASRADHQWLNHSSTSESSLGVIARTVKRADYEAG